MMMIRTVLVFVAFFFVLLKSTFGIILDKNQFKTADVLRKFRSAILIVIILYAFVCIVYLVCDMNGYLDVTYQKWMYKNGLLLILSYNQFVWDVVKCLAPILSMKAWKSLYTPNRIKYYCLFHYQS